MFLIVVFLINLFLGEFMVCLLSSGKLVRWQKDTNHVIVIPPCPGFYLAGDQGTMLFYTEVEI